MHLLAEATPDSASFWSTLLREQGPWQTLLFAVIVFGLGFAWKVLLPLLKDYLVAATKLHNTMADTIPTIARETTKIKNFTSEIPDIGQQVKEIHGRVMRG